MTGKEYTKTSYENSQIQFIKAGKNSKWWSKAAKIWIVQNHLIIPGLTQLRRDYIAFFRITNKKSVPGVCTFKRVIDVNDERTYNKRTGQSCQRQDRLSLAPKEP